MTNEAVPEPGLLAGTFIGRDTFRRNIQSVVRMAADEGWRELVLCDASFADWPLGERDTAEALQAWMRSDVRQFTMLAKSYDEVIRFQPRFVEWRRQWSHRIECRACRSVDARDLPSVLWSSRWTIQRIDPVLNSGVAGEESDRRLTVKADLDQWLARSAPGFPVTTLGL